MWKVLLPMALDYHVRSRDNDVIAVATVETSNLNGDASEFSTSLQVRLGRHLKIRITISEHASLSEALLTSRNRLKFKVAEHSFPVYRC